MIEIRDLKKQYGSSIPLKNVTCTINKGDVIAVIGPSGTGKSTLLRCINLIENPTFGQILVDGEDITDPSCDINKVRTKLGMVFQSFNLYEHLTVIENCMIAQTVVLKRSRQEAYEKAMKVLALVGMESKALQYPSQLSGGQKQRVAIARTLATDPEIILFDEPTSALDPLNVEEVESVIMDLSRQGRTMMIVTHSMKFARRVSNRVFYMDQGGIYEDGPSEQIFESPQKERTRKFIYQLLSLDMYITEQNHDFYAEIGKLIAFCQDRDLSSKRATCLCAAYEEYLVLYFRYAKGEKRIRVTAEYNSGTDNLSLSFIPYDVDNYSYIEKEIYESLEYQLFAHYINGYREEHSDYESGIRYTYDIQEV